MVLEVKGEECCLWYKASARYDEEGGNIGNVGRLA